MRAAQVPHIFYSPDKDGAMAVYRTHGNPFGHIILRGGKTPNYHAEDIEKARQQLASVGVTQRMVVDFSHGNSEKNHLKQLNVADEIMAQMRAGSTAIAGIMAESFLQEGNQKVVADQPLCYGQSITDACLHWDDSEVLLRKLAAASRERKTLLAK